MDNPVPASSRYFWNLVMAAITAFGTVMMLSPPSLWGCIGAAVFVAVCVRQTVLMNRWFKHGDQSGP